jgi:ArsR family transcriptional regulator
MQSCVKPIKTSLKPAKDLARSLDADLFKALGDPTRLQILACLAGCCGPATVSQIAACTSVDLSVVSRHLKQLEAAGALTSQKQGKNVLYTVAYAPLSQALARVSEAVCKCDPANRPTDCNCGCLCCKTADKSGCKGGCC